MGFVKTIGEGVINASGLKNAGYGELVFFPLVGQKGFICSLRKNSVDILVLGKDYLIKSGTLILGSGSGLRIPVGKEMLGRVVNPLGELIDKKGPKLGHIRYTANINGKAPGIIHRQTISEPLFTGLKIIDSLVPIGRGQRELIIGDKGTGKSSVLFDTILNQKFENYKNSINRVFCIYVSIGQKFSSVKTLSKRFKKLSAHNHVIVVSAHSSAPAAMQYIAPYAGCAIGEFFMNYSSSLVVYDDLTQHAMSYRQVSLLLRRPPGREAYPGDVFYLHSRLLERAAKLADKFGGGSLTALPVIETMFGDVTSYIPTNVISITDGQIFLDRIMFRDGQMPAVNVGLSVSRVGSAAQLPILKKIVGSLKLTLAQYREVKDFVKFGSNLDLATLKLIRKGELLTYILTQERYSPISPEEQIVVFYSSINEYLDNVKLKNVDKFNNKLLNYFKNSILFSPHFESLRLEKYFNKFGLSGLFLSLHYFTYYFLKKEENRL